jgi:hypothetical protein
MAITLEGMRNAIKTGLFGRRVGLDNNDFLIGIPGTRMPVNAATSDTTGTAIPAYGFCSVDTTTNDGWTLGQPTVGATVTLFCATTSTGVRSIATAPATMTTTAGNAGSTITITERGGFITLMGVSTTQWAEVARSSTAACYASS